MITIGGIEFDLKLSLLIILSTILPMLDYYDNRLTGSVLADRVLLYLVAPLLVIVLVLRESPAGYGFRPGNWRVGLLYTVAGCVGMALILWFVARTPAMQDYYAKRTPAGVPALLATTGVYFFVWEFMWRGFLLFGLASVLGPGPAILLQAVPFAFMHLNKPELETLSTIFGGIAFGFVAWQSGSFFYPFLIHWFIAAFTMLIASGRLG